MSQKKKKNKNKKKSNYKFKRQFKLPELKIPEFKLPEFKLPENFKMSDLLDVKKIPVGFKVLGIIALAIVVVCIVLICKSCASNPKTNATVNPEYTESIAESESIENEIAQAEKLEAERQAKIDAEIASYGNIGIINCTTHTFVRKEPNTTSERIGKLSSGGACTIVEELEDGWVHITSGGIDGYVKSEYLYKGDMAIQKARENIKERAIITKDDVLIREDSTINSVSIGKVYSGERYVIEDQVEDWILIRHDDISGYINKDYAEIKECLDEARYLKNDRDKETALNLYTELGITNFESGVLNVRSKPSTDSKIVGMMSPGCAVQIDSTDGEWMYVKSGPVEGYVKAEYISTGGDATSKVLQKVELMAISETDGLNVRSGPGTNYKVVTSIAANERYPVITETFNDDFTEQWVQIDLGDSDEDGEALSAYVSKEYVTVRYAANEAVKYSQDEIMAANSDSRRSSIVKYALQFVGNRYVWGGTSLTNGCDCSGFTLSIMRNFGISLPHSSAAQSKMGKAIKSSQMRPGDLIFYANKSGTVNHVTIYIGGGRIVGAQSARSGIKTAAWNYRTPVKIVNILGD